MEGLSRFVSNITEGFGCILSRDCSSSDDRYQDVDCSLGVVPLIAFVFCNILVVYAIERIVSVDASFLGRTITMSFVASFIAFLFLYQDESGSGVVMIEVAASVALALGLEQFYRDPEHDVEVSTNLTSVA